LDPATRIQAGAERWTGQPPQDGLTAAGEAEASIASLELAIYQPQTVTLELFASKAALTLFGNSAESDAGEEGGDDGES